MNGINTEISPIKLFILFDLWISVFFFRAEGDNFTKSSAEKHFFYLSDLFGNNFIWAFSIFIIF